jgi:hypothetical protein
MCPPRNVNPFVLSEFMAEEEEEEEEDTYL